MVRRSLSEVAAEHRHAGCSAACSLSFGILLMVSGGGLTIWGFGNNAHREVGVFGGILVVTGLIMTVCGIGTLNYIYMLNKSTSGQQRFRRTQTNPSRNPVVTGSCYTQGVANYNVPVGQQQAYPRGTCPGVGCQSPRPGRAQCQPGHQRHPQTYAPASGHEGFRTIQTNLTPRIPIATEPSYPKEVATCICNMPVGQLQAHHRGTYPAGNGYQSEYPGAAKYPQEHQRPPQTHEPPPAAMTDHGQHSAPGTPPSKIRADDPPPSYESVVNIQRGRHVMMVTYEPAMVFNTR